MNFCLGTNSADTCLCIVRAFVHFVNKSLTGSVECTDVLESKYCVQGTSQSRFFLFFFLREGPTGKLLKSADTQ